jgi:general secretion pathway protein F
MFYEIKAYREPEGVVVLAYNAADTNDALQIAESQGYRVISSRAKLAWRKPRRRYRFPLGLFSQELLALLEAGLTLHDVIETLAEKEQHPQARKVYSELIRLLREGQPLSHAMERFPSEFPALYVATVRASEKTGDLKEALSRYLAYQAQLDAVRKKVVSAAIYPTLLMIVGGLVIVFLLAYVVPKFSHVYEGLGDNLPFMSQMLLSWGKLFQANAIWIVLAGVAVIATLSYVLTRKDTLPWVSRKLWKIPAVGERMRIYQLARFYRTLGMLLRGGIPLVTALDMVSGLLQSSLRVNLHQSRQAIREGLPISESLSKHGLTTEVAIRMLRVGERSGNLGEMMERIASFYDEDMARWVEWFTRLFEPLLMIFIGLVIGIIVLLMYLPIFELAGAIQ